MQIRILVLSLLLAAGARGAADPLAEARWIWAPGSGTPPVETVCFRSGLTVTEKSPVQSAELIVTADNLYEAYLNGRPAGANTAEPNDWNDARRYDVTALLSAGWNTIAIEAQNTAAGPAGLIARLLVRHADGTEETLATDARWRCSHDPAANREQPNFDDQAWPLARELGPHGIAPWGHLAIREKPVPPDAPERAGTDATARFAPEDRILFVGRDCSLYRPKRGGNAYDSLTVTIFNPRDSRSFPEHDLPAPMKVGRALLALAPGVTGSSPRVLFDAGKGALGSPSVSFDGRTILFSMAPAGEAFFHLYRMSATGGAPVQLTRGAFHDIDPVELPDGRIAFVSTRIGRFEEYHNTPSRSLFTINADGSDLHPLTHTFIFDNEPEVLADGRLLFIRSDNFFDRGKVETTLHAVHPDGMHGLTEFGLDLGPEYGGRLRAYNCGSPAPLPDGRVAFVTGSGIAIGRPGSAESTLHHLRIAAGDVAAMPDGRLLCSLAERRSLRKLPPDEDGNGPTVRYETLAVVDPADGAAAPFFRSDDGPLHSPVFLGPRERPPLLTTLPLATNEPATGVLYCQNVYNTRNTTAGWKHVRAVRVLAGQGLTYRSSHSYIVHAGNETVELGTVPLAPDGSFAVEVPADTAIAFQAVDAEGRSELNGMSWVFVRPGEKRGCIGCHAPRQQAPAAHDGASLAMRTTPVKLPLVAGLHRFRGNNAAVTGLMELQFDRYREVASLNAHETSVTNLVAWLGSTSAVQRAAAATRLAVFRAPAAAGPLAALLTDKDREVRLAAAMTLAACGTRETVPPLFSALTDRDPLVAQAAAVALENLTGTTASFDAFAEAPARKAAATAWAAQVGDWNAWTAALAGRLSSTNRDERRRAAVALLHTGGPAAAEPLREALTRDLADNPLPAWRKGHGGDNARFNSFDAVNPRSLQALARLCRGDDAVPFLASHAQRLADPGTGNLFFSEAAFEALGAIDTPAARGAVREAFLALKPYYELSRWYGDHDALIACHASPPHFFALRALERDEPANLAPLVPAMLRSVPTDTDRALFPGLDDYEALVGRLVRRAGESSNVIETCLALLGDPAARPVPAIEAAVRTVHGAWAGTPDAPIRAAQLLSLVCRDTAFEPRLRAAYERHRAAPVDIPRVFDTGIPVVKKLPQRHWICFFLGRALAQVGGPATVDTLIASLRDHPAEAAAGRPDPQGPGVAFLHDDLTPCWRAAAAWALGRLGDARAVPVLEAVIRDDRNAPDTRHAAAVALRTLAGPGAAARLADAAGEVSIRSALLGAP